MTIKDKIGFFNQFVKVRLKNNGYFPLFAGLSLTRRCNLKCKYCNEWNNLCEELTAKQIFSIIDELSSFGTKLIGFDGGEPLLREDLGSIIEYAKSKGLIVSLNTNGLLVPKRISAIKYVDLLDISLDGPEEIHDYIRGENSYGQVMKAIEVLKKNNIPLKLICTLSRYNINHIDFILRKAEDLKIEVRFGPLHSVHFWREGESLESLYPDISDYKKTLEKLINLKRKNKFIANSLSSLRYIQNWPFEDKVLTCFASKFICRIEPNGDVYPCTILRQRVHPINCIAHGIKQAFQQLLRVNCGRCWCMGTLELNYLLSFDISAICNNIHLLKYFLKNI